MYLRHQVYTLYYRHVCILVFLHVFAYSMLLRCMLKFKRLACGSEDVTQYVSIKLKQLYSVPSTKFYKFLIYFNCQLPNSCTPFIMVDCLITLITTLLRLHQSTNTKQDFLLCKNIIYPE